MGLDDEEMPVISQGRGVLEDAPAVLKGLKRLRFPSDDQKKLRKGYGLAL